ncbi:MAG: 16S rRNA (uracil(1498)-N(3))-methyltransferase [Armatimonadetes bacterium]|nr:16S rRNA (uracil(1498)-N(3))-methyltransferase [Armatimonadota bacterium]
MTRFFVRPDQIDGGRVTLDADDAHHLRTVLLARPGDLIAILDGTGREWPAVLETVGKARAEARLGEPFEPSTEPQTQITVAQALPKMAEKMEQVLQRGTEIGVSHFWAYQSERSLTHLSGERHAKRLARWQSIVKTAAEQAHRAVLPTVCAEGSLRDVLAAVPDFDLALLAHPDAHLPTLRETLSDSPRIGGRGAILVIIGPESGFTDTEVARAAGAQAISLGPRILRTETAAMVMAAQIFFALEPPSVR